MILNPTQSVKKRKETQPLITNSDFHYVSNHQLVSSKNSINQLTKLILYLKT